MQAVGKLGSYISRSVYTVSGPFRPFGGAVDIIVVEQPDGSFKSSPWYVRFGKFQGVLKSKEKVVNISVNGVEADFHMYLDNKGEAFFLKKVDLGEGGSVCSPPSSSGEDADRESGNRWGVNSKSCNYERNGDGVAMSRSNSRRARILGLVWGRRSVKGEGIKEEENGCGVVRTDSLERAEIAADLLELKWSTNLASSRLKKDNNAPSFPSGDISNDEVNETLQVNDCRSSNREVEDTIVETNVGISECGIQREPSVENVRENTNLLCSLALPKSDCRVKSVTKIVEVANDDSFKGVDSRSVLTISSSSDSNCSREEEQIIAGQEEIKKIGQSSVGSVSDPQISNGDFVPLSILESRISEEELLLFGDMDDFSATDAKIEQFADGVNESGQEKYCSGFSLDQSIINDYIRDDESLQRRRLETISNVVCGNKNGNHKSRELTRMVRSLPTVGSISNNLEANDRGHFSDPLLYPDVKSGSESDNLLPGAQRMDKDFKISESQDGTANLSVGDTPISVDSLRGSGRGWSFSYRKSRSMKVSHADMNGCENLNDAKNVHNTCDLEGGRYKSKAALNKNNVKTLTPTSEQLASLNLKEGKNTVIFTFSTATLGKQQVDARIFLWRWDTRIVISDVDGTITRSDVLGQVMPWVGMDWSHIGVAPLFSAIKDNGYQLLFLSARSILQSFHTRQFLFNIKQDGKALPEGPVVISPDGLFPSLFREVVRRAPHEFKIGCLEDIKALFPADRNPFYAGFGNRDTDEFSYLKVGIPKGKIFIINPKGEIVVNRGVNTKSYLSLHTLVHGMFPSMSSSEKEDYNSWNYWKLPPPLIDI